MIKSLVNCRAVRCLKNPLNSHPSVPPKMYANPQILLLRQEKCMVIISSQRYPCHSPKLRHKIWIRRIRLKLFTTQKYFLDIFNNLNELGVTPLLSFGLLYVLFRDIFRDPPSENEKTSPSLRITEKSLNLAATEWRVGIFTVMWFFFLFVFFRIKCGFVFMSKLCHWFHNRHYRKSGMKFYRSLVLCWFKDFGLEPYTHYIIFIC